MSPRRWTHSSSPRLRRFPRPLPWPVTRWNLCKNHEPSSSNSSKPLGAAPPSRATAPPASHKSPELFPTSTRYAAVQTLVALSWRLSKHRADHRGDAGRIHAHGNVSQGRDASRFALLATSHPPLTSRLMIGVGWIKRKHAADAPEGGASSRTVRRSVSNPASRAVHVTINLSSYGKGGPDRGDEKLIRGTVAYGPRAVGG